MSEHRYDPKYFVEVIIRFPKPKKGGIAPEDGFIIARVSDGQFVQYPRELSAWSGATSLGELLRDGFTLSPAKGRV